MNIRPIKTETDYRDALKEVESLMSAEADTPEGDRLDVLTNRQWRKPGSKESGPPELHIPGIAPVSKARSRLRLSPVDPE